MAKEGWHFLPRVNKKIPNISYHGRRGELIQEKDRCCRKHERAEVFDVMVGHPVTEHSSKPKVLASAVLTLLKPTVKLTNFSKVKISS